MVTLADFNKTLKGAIDRAKVIEKSDPAGGIDVWIKIAEYALAFAKKQSDFTLRRMIEQRVEGIIQRVRKIKDELRMYSAPTPPSTVPESLESPSPKKISSKTSATTKKPGELASAATGQDSAKLQVTLGQLRKDTPPTPEGKSIQDWLMAMPDGFKEIPASPTASVLPTSGAPGKGAIKSPSSEGDLTPAQQYFKELAEQAESEEKKFGAKIDPSKDPFAQANIPVEIPPDKRVCFACGMVIDKQTKFCPYCGTT